MTSCPVCESPQAEGSECEICGRSAPAVRAIEVEVAPLEGLEPTLAAAEPAPPGGEPMPDLEPTLQASAGEVSLAPVPELEPTASAPVEAVLELVPDLEPTSAPASTDPPTELPLFPVCRYCRTPAGPGERICGRCGMRLPGGIAPLAAAGTGPRPCSCGTPITRSICPSCGARNATA